MKAKDLFNDPSEPSGPPLTDELIERAERCLSVKLPASYTDLLRQCNGGYLALDAFPKAKSVEEVPPQCWDTHWLEIRQLSPISGENGIDHEHGSNYLIEEWGYPSPGVVLCSEGHTAFMLDYRQLAPNQEPPVIYVDLSTFAEPRSFKLAESFGAFIKALVS